MNMEEAAISRRVDGGRLTGLRSGPFILDAKLMTYIEMSDQQT